MGRHKDPNKIVKPEGLCHNCGKERPREKGRRYCDDCNHLCRICWKNTTSNSSAYCKECYDRELSPKRVKTTPPSEIVPVVVAGPSAKEEALEEIVRTVFANNLLTHSKICSMRNGITTCDCGLKSVGYRVFDLLPDMKPQKKVEAPEAAKVESPVAA